MNIENSSPFSLFYNESVEFYQCAQILQDSKMRINNDDFFFEPIMFLLRHSIELVLKAIIIKEIMEKQENWLSFKLQPSNKRIESIHSIRELFESLKTMASGISTDMNNTEIDIEETIDALDKVDASSTFFRYPFEKNGKRNARAMTEEVDEYCLSVPCCIGSYLAHVGIDSFSTPHREQGLDYLEDDVAELYKQLNNLYAIETQ